MTDKKFLLSDGSIISFSHNVVIGSGQRSYILVHYKSDHTVADIRRTLIGTEDALQVVTEYCSQNGLALSDSHV